MSVTISIESEAKSTIDLERLRILQGGLKDLTKENYDRGKQSIIENGYSEPISVWFDPKDSEPWILSGTQRYLILTQMKKEGFIIPPIPYNEVKAPTIEKAKKKLLALASAYGKVNSQSLYEYSTENEIDVEYLACVCNYHEVNMEKFTEEYYTVVELKDEPQKGKTKTKKTYLCPKCFHEFESE
jgi:hypothetical protein